MLDKVEKDLFAENATADQFANLHYKMLNIILNLNMQEGPAYD